MAIGGSLLNSLTSSISFVHIFIKCLLYTGGFTDDCERRTPSVNRNGLSWKITMLLMKNITSKLYHVLFLFRSVICRFSNTPSTIYLPQQLRFSISTSTFSNDTMSTLYICTFWEGIIQMKRAGFT
jgi:hypothetical protein